MPFGKLEDLVRLDGMPSLGSLRRFIAERADFPLLQARKPHETYLMDLDAAAAFVATHWRDGREERRRQRIEAERCGQIGLFD